jgi:hypothetical protein
MQESTEEAEASLLIPTESVIAIHAPDPNRTWTWTTAHTVRRKAAKRSEKGDRNTERKKRRVQESLLPPRRSPRGLITTSITGASAPPPPNATVNATVVASIRRRSSRHVLPTSGTASPAPPPSTATMDASIRRRSSRQTQLPPASDTSDDVRHSPDPSREERLSELADYRKINGNCNVRRRDSENSKLGTWVKNQRYQYGLHLEGKASQMTVSRIQALKSLDFEWDRYGATASWEDGLRELARLPQNSRGLQCSLRLQRKHQAG